MVVVVVAVVMVAVMVGVRIAVVVVSFTKIFMVGIWAAVAVWVAVRSILACYA
jgi:hypothetical protein